MEFSTVLTSSGWAIVAAALTTEVVALFGAASMRIRRLLPVKSPITLQMVGCILLMVGAGVLAVGFLLRGFGV
ncbi:MAG: hypothetical protein ACRC1K_10455 [Planctomycetia bacterium]